MTYTADMAWQQGDTDASVTDFCDLQVQEIQTE